MHGVVVQTCCTTVLEKIRRKGKVRRKLKEELAIYSCIYLFIFLKKKRSKTEEVRRKVNRCVGPWWRCHLWHWFDSRTASSLNRGCPPLYTSWLKFHNTDVVQEEVGRETRAEKGPCVLHSGRCICCVRSIWARPSHHQRAVFRVVEEAQLQGGLYQEGGAQLSAATGKIVGG